MRRLLLTAALIGGAVAAMTQLVPAPVTSNSSAAVSSRSAARSAPAASIASAVAYTPQAGEFLPDTGIGESTSSVNANGGVDTAPMTVSFWVFGTLDRTNDYNLLNNVLISSNPGDPYQNCEAGGSLPAQGFCIIFDNSPYLARFNLDNAVGASLTDGNQFTGTGLPSFPDGQWNHYLISINPATGNYAVYLNGANAIPGAINKPGKINNILTNLNHPGGFAIAQSAASAGPAYVWMSEVYIAQSSIVCTGLGVPYADCPASNTIAPSMLAKFISGGKPVNLGASCAVPTGAPPALCFRFKKLAASNENEGSATTPIPVRQAWGFLTGGGHLYPAPYGPAGVPAHQATMRWVQSQRGASAGAGVMTTSPGGMPINPGDLIVILAESGASSGGAPGPIQCPSGFTTIGPAADTHERVSSAMCYKFADVGETGVYAVSCAPCGTRTNGWVMADYVNVASVDQKGALVNPSNIHQLTAPHLTTTAPSETVVSAYVNWNANMAGRLFSPPPRGYLRYKIPASGSPAQMMWVDEYGVPTGSNPQRQFSVATADTGTGFTLTLVPN